MQPFQASAAPAPNPNALAGWMANPHPSSSVPSGVVSASPFQLQQPNQGRFHVTNCFGIETLVCVFSGLLSLVLHELLMSLILRPELI